MTATFTPVPGADPEVVADITRQLALPIARPRKAPRRSLAAARALMERRGEATLTAEPEAPGKSAKVTVRVYFMSEGGEIVAMDTGPLTTRAADELEHDCLRSDSDAIGVLRMKLDGSWCGSPRGFEFLAIVDPRWGRQRLDIKVVAHTARTARVLPALTTPPVLVESDERKAA